jgi:hypothetical protein
LQCVPEEVESKEVNQTKKSQIGQTLNLNVSFPNTPEVMNFCMQQPTLLLATLFLWTKGKCELGPDSNF